MEREFSQDVYKFVDPWQMSYEPGMANSDDKHGHQIQMELFPSDRICNTDNMKCVLFSGSIVSCNLGLTVAHAFKQGDEIAVKTELDKVNDKKVGKCLETFDKLIRQDGTQLNADLAILKLETGICSVGNIVRWPYCHSSRTLQIKFYKSQEIPEDAGVIILDQNGYFQNGYILRTRMNYGDLHNVIEICASETEEVAITKPGDSGALVMSIPNNRDDFVYVYAISTGICRQPNGKSSTIANSPWEVVHEISTSKKSQFVNDAAKIEFTQASNR